MKTYIPTDYHTRASNVPLRPRHMIATLIAVLFIALCNQQHTAHAQSEGTPFHNMVDRVTKFGNRIPQEKVYVHMDNTAYFLGDTIWFKAYLRRTDTDKPSHVSNTLYVELRDPDGYLKERKQIWITAGEGDGFFALADSSFRFGGYYELRAYTRWQLNWGATEHPHTSIADKWFFNKAAARDFFRDYEKLYSRVFPIYSEYEEADGQMYPVMWTRPLRRQFKKDPQQAKPTLTLYPEGGNLVAGVENRVAFEAAMDDGKYLEGWLHIGHDSVHTQNRGRGIFTICPSLGEKTEVTFVTQDGQNVKGKLDKPDADGVSVRLSHNEDGWQAEMNVTGSLCADSLAITLMHEGCVEDFHTVASLPQKSNTRTLSLNKATKSGVHQFTVFDTQGRVLADRLFFVATPEDMKPTLEISGRKESYAPYAPVVLNIKGKEAGGNVSVSVRSDRSTTYLNDNGSILTEMLLASEIRGFVPQPGWYFEANDDEHRTALDLLMLTQGWRRFPWQDMALRGHFEIVHPAEKTPVLTGAVHTYEAIMKFDPLVMEDMITCETFMGTDSNEIAPILNERFGFNEAGGRRTHYGKDLKVNKRANSINATKELRKRLMLDGEKLKHEVKVRADFFHQHGKKAERIERKDDEDGSNKGIMAQALRSAQDWKVLWGESVTQDGTFRMELPVIDRFCYLTIAASDTTKWSKAEKNGKKEHQWYWHDETAYPEFYVRLSFPYPNFTKPYSYYQNHLASAPAQEARTYEGENRDAEPHTQMKEVNVTGKKRNMLKSLTISTPVMKMGAMEAYNMVVDAGLLNGWFSSSMQFGMALARALMSDMGQNRRYEVNINYDEDMSNGNKKFALIGGNPYATIKKAGLLSMLDSVYVYTDYAPRNEGSRRYQASNQPDVYISVKLSPIPSKASVDRYMKLPGYARSAEFYSPDYSKRTPTQGETDLRRTLYWNPYVQLDNNGEAHVTLYNNSFTSGITVSTQGQSTNGTLLWNKEE